MLLDPTPDQEFLRDTTAKFLANTVPVDELRRRRDDPAGFDAEYGDGGAELGWTSLLVREEDGGGTVSGHGPVDLALIAYEFGRHAAPGPLMPCNVVAGALSAAGASARTDLVGHLLSGDSVASWCFAEAQPMGHDPDGLELGDPSRRRRRDPSWCSSRSGGVSSDTPRTPHPGHRRPHRRGFQPRRARPPARTAGQCPRTDGDAGPHPALLGGALRRRPGSDRRRGRGRRCGARGRVERAAATRALVMLNAEMPWGRCRPRSTPDSSSGRSTATRSADHWRRTRS